MAVVTVNKLKSELQDECFEYDGNGFAIKNLDNPLFGTVSMNIYGLNMNIYSFGNCYKFIALCTFDFLRNFR